MKKKPSTAVVLFSILIAVDLLLIILHSVFGWSVINLDEEANIAAWYSSAKLLAVAVFAWMLWQMERDKPKLERPRLSILWLLVALVFLGLSVDETATLHERTARYIMEESMIGLDIRETALSGDATKDSFAWVIILSPLILATVLFFLFFFYTRLFRTRAGCIPALIGLACFVGAILMEATIYFSPNMAQWGAEEVSRYQFYIIIEETGEILGTTLFLMAFYRYAKFLRGVKST